MIVTAQGPETATPRVALTGSDGAYRLVGLVAGSWRLTFELEGFTTVSLRTRVEARQPARVDVTLRVATIAEEIIVTSQAAVISHRGSPRPRQRQRLLPAGVDPAAWSRTDFDTETYEPVEENRFLDPHDHPLSTFAIDVDSASFANVRRFLNEGRQPPRDAVRVEELVNYYPDAYAYESPAGDGITLQADVTSAPWFRHGKSAR